MSHAYRYCAFLFCSLIVLALISSSAACQLRPAGPDIQALVNAGEFQKADLAIREKLAQDTTMSASDRLALDFERQRMDRIKRDFRKTEPEVRAFIAKWMPDAREADYQRWEKSGALEMMKIDGQKRYFNNAARNLFRIEPAARALWADKHRGDPPTTGIASESGLDSHIATVMSDAVKTGTPFVQPVRLRIGYRIAVDADAVPAGETIRCWIPFPREIPGRQGDITVLSSEPPRHLVADNDTYLQRTVYLEKTAVAGQKTVFSAGYEYTAHGVYVPVEASKVKSVPSRPDLEPFLREEPPHILFTPALRALSAQVVGQERNPLLVARRLFSWIDANIPWASAREYSTVPSLSDYAFTNRHGDCGMQTMLFVTLLRMNGIPARWQSGWEFRPPENSMHDWGMVYFEPYGWVPMDATYGPRKSDDEAMKFFYVNGMDSYRLIFNDATWRQFYPAKIHPRSETVDSQRGEVEWRGGNLYFDQWDWDMEWSVVGK
jgi:hypothetical protein